MYPVAYKVENFWTSWGSTSCSAKLISYVADNTDGDFDSAVQETPTNKWILTHQIEPKTTGSVNYPRVLTSLKTDNTPNLNVHLNKQTPTPK